MKLKSVSYVHCPLILHWELAVKHLSARPRPGATLPKRSANDLEAEGFSMSMESNSLVLEMKNWGSKSLKWYVHGLTGLMIQTQDF